MSRVVLSLGSNTGESDSILTEAIERIGSLPQTQVTKVSPRYITAPWGGVEQPDFINLCLEIETALSPEELLAATQEIERAAHRVRFIKWGPRTLDIDLIFYEGVTCRTETLTLPHPYFSKRAFVLVPLADLYPEKTVFGIHFAPFLNEVNDQIIRKEK